MHHLFSAPRTGSTLVYRIMNMILGKVDKRHKYKGERCVTTIRHPYNSMISTLLRHNKPLTRNNFKIMIGGTTRTLNVLTSKEFLGKKNLILKYEDFYKNHNYIIDEICKFYNVKITDEKRALILKEVSMENTLKIVSGISFSTYDKKTYLHGKHISKYKGETDYKKLLTPEIIKFLDNHKGLQKMIKMYY